jgi:hypothetical protein
MSSHAQKAAGYQFDGGSLAGKDCRPHSSTIASERSGSDVAAAPPALREALSIC